MIDFFEGLAFFVILYHYVMRILRWRKDALPLPPGPKRLPVVGNLFNMPRTLLWETCHKWSQELSKSNGKVDETLH